MLELVGESCAWFRCYPPGRSTLDEQLSEGVVLADFHDGKYCEACRQLGLELVGNSVCAFTCPIVVLEIYPYVVPDCSRDQCEEFRDPRKHSLCCAQSMGLSEERLDELSDSESIPRHDTHSDDVEDPPTEEPAKCTLPKVSDSQFQ